MKKAPQGPRRIEVGVRELRDHLSRWLDEVEAGREIVVTERGRPVARIVGASDTSRLEALIAAGLVTPASMPARPWDDRRRVKMRGSIMEFLPEQKR